MTQNSFDSNPARSGAGCAGGAIAIVFGLIFLAAGIGIASSGLRGAGTDQKAKTWPAVNCRVERSEVVARNGPAGGYDYKVAYTYASNSHLYTSTRYSRIGSSSSNYADEERLALTYPAGSTSFCCVDPANPSYAVLNRRSSTTWFMAAFGLPFALIGLVTLVNGVRSAITGTTTQARQRAASSPQGCSGAVFLLIFTAIGGAILWWAFLRPWRQAHDVAKSWVRTPCHIIASDVRTHLGRKGNTYSADILYAYQHGGREFKSNRYNVFAEPSGGQSVKERLVRQYPPGMQTTCYVNPADPVDAVLVPKAGVSPVWMLLPLLFILVGISGLFGMAKRFAVGS